MKKNIYSGIKQSIKDEIKKEDYLDNSTNLKLSNEKFKQYGKAGGLIVKNMVEAYEKNLKEVTDNKKQ